MPATKLSTAQVVTKLNQNPPTGFNKPGRNKGERGQLIEGSLGVANSSDLKDLIDGEIKSFTVGETIAVTMLQHCLSEILEDSVCFADSKVADKLSQTIYVGYTRSNDYVGSAVVNLETDPVHYQELAEDYEFICDTIRAAFDRGDELHTITGPNKLLQIRTKASKTKAGTYVPLTYAGQFLNDKAMAFYLLANFGKQVIAN
jgi:DNA mismatch repair protein MutH